MDATATPRTITELLLDESTELLIALSLDGRVLSWNRAAEAAFGHTAAAAIGRPFEELVAPAARLHLTMHRVHRPQQEPFVAVRAPGPGSRRLTDMAHDLRSPLNTIIGFTSLLHAGKAGALTDRQREFLGDVLSSSHHLLHLLDEVIELARIDAGEREARR